MERKILVATDTSVYSTNEINYLARLFTDLEDIHLDLFCVVHTSAMAAGSGWVDELDLMAAISPETRKRLNQANHYMKEAVSQLGRRGVAPERISTDVKLTGGSIHGEIIHKARKGLYDALVIGRRGIGKLEEFIMGSVSTSLLEKCHDVPRWIIDGHVDSRKFLVPVDGSPYALKAVDHLAFILKGNPYAEVTLFNSEAMFANQGATTTKQCHTIWGKDWCDLHMNREDSLFHAPEQILIEQGFPLERIYRLTTNKGLYPSRQIVRQALIDDFGTIVMGRRGEDSIKGMFKGVSSQVIAMAVDVAIWVVG